MINSPSSMTRNIVFFYNYFLLQLLYRLKTQGTQLLCKHSTTQATTRDTSISFPTNNLSYEKIIMSYNMRCKDDVVNTSGSINNIGCGAWDYSCHTNIHDSTRIDSILSTTPSHLISNYSGSLYEYSLNPIFNYYQFYQQNTTISSTIYEDSTVTGSYSKELDFVLATEKNSSKSQFLYRASELLSFGLSNDSIDALTLFIADSNFINNTPHQANFLKIKIKSTLDSTLKNNHPHSNGFTEVYHANTNLLSGEIRCQFHTPFAWDATSNIIVELSITNASNISSTTFILGDSVSFNCGLSSSDATSINVQQNASISLPTSNLSSISNEITVSFWVYGNENSLPFNSTILEGLDGNGSRTINIHFPWSNSRVYWDCGNNAGSYDRIDKLASQNDFSNQWNHWTFTKNCTSGDMKMYKDGILWHSGNNKTAPINIQSLKLGSNANGSSNLWDGNIKELQIFNKELSQSTISEWYNSRLLQQSISHPNINECVAYYPLNNTNSITCGISSLSANISGNVIWEVDRGEEINTFFNSSNFRPTLKLFQGDYILNTSSITVLDSALATPNTVKELSVFSNSNTLLNDSIAIVSSNDFWHAYSYTYDTNGIVLTTHNWPIDSSITISDLNYYQRYPMAFQIMSFVTPYGAYLDLGTEGKTWFFDVTDFAPILHGNKRINMTSGGQWQEDMDIKFHFIIGTPPRDIIDIQQIWRPQSKGYTSIMNNNCFEPRDVVINPNASEFKIRTVITGHGQEGEFVSQNHFLNLNGGATEYTWPVWTECGANPIYPQGGTWIYDRAGWCPGQASDLREDDITSLVTPGQVHNIDYGVANASGSSNYWVSSQLVSYSNINHNLDASLVDIITPTNKVKYSRINPSCGKPKIIIKNTGSQQINSLTIEYWTNNNSVKETQLWTGALNFLEEEVIELNDPASLWENLLATNNNFHIQISEPNQSQDQYIHNNYLTSKFEPTPVYDNSFAIWLETNSGSVGVNQSETSWEIHDNNNNLTYQSAGGGSLMINTQYRDTLTFNDGCYSFRINDSDDDGIDFWANSDGAGMARFRKLGASWIKVFEGDFGSFVHHEFRIENNITSNQESFNEWSFYPNPTQNQITINGYSQEPTNFILSDSLGKQIKKFTIDSDGVFSKRIDLSYLNEGVYLLKIINTKEEVVKKLIKL